MNYSKEQLRRLHYLLSDQWVSDDIEQTEREFQRVLAQIDSPYELHQFAGNFNWDGGFAEMQDVLRHPLCDKGTGLMIYYVGGAPFLYSKLNASKPLILDQSLRFEFLKEIERMFERGEFRHSWIKFDPTNARGRNFLQKKGAEFIPPYMKQPTEGEEVEILNFLPES